MLYVVIPVFNRQQFTRTCLESLRKQTVADFKTIVVDDGSTDGTPEMIRNEFPEVVLLHTPGDLFWTATTNIGIQYALDHDATYVMTMNNDVIIPERFIEKMIFWAKQNPNALLGAYAVNAVTKQPNYGGEIINWMLNTSKDLLRILPPEQRKGIHKVTHFPGRGLLIPHKVFDKVGLFDEKALPHYYADYDFTHHAIRNGFDVYCNYDAFIYTYPDESGDKANRKRKSFKNYYNHLFGIRGGGNLKNFTLYTFRNCPPPFIPYFLLSGYLRRLLGYLVK